MPNLGLTVNESARAGIGLTIVGLLLLIILYYDKLIDMSCIERFSTLTFIIGLFTFLSSEYIEHAT